MTPPKVTVVLGLYNGAQFIEDQLNSLATQTLRPTQVLVSDDGSDDDGPDMVRRSAQTDWPPETLILQPGPKRGFAANFLETLISVCQDTDYIAFCDQDDIWMPDKLARATQHLAVFDTTPAVYASTTWVCDAKGRKQYVSRSPRQPAGFANALVQNILAGNTMVLNKAAVEVVRQMYQEKPKIIAHDWWVYQIITAIGGQVVFDPEPSVYYRQHGDNVIGSNKGAHAIIARGLAVLKGRFKAWNDVQLMALYPLRHHFLPEHQAMLERFSGVRKAALPKRLWWLMNSGVYRQGWLGRFELIMATIFGRV